MKETFQTIGSYILLLTKVLQLPHRWRLFFRELVRVIYQHGMGSVWIVILVSFFIGAVLTMQLAINVTAPMVPKFLLGFSVREMIILEFSSTVICMLLAGKCGSSIASEIGTMRVTEQIDALDIMGVNSANYIILPKIIGMMLFVPFLIIISITIGCIGGFFSASGSADIPVGEFLVGLRYSFLPSRIVHTIFKGEVYAFLIASISAFYGYYVSGGALEVGRASTKAVVYGNISILLSDLVITQLALL